MSSGSDNEVVISKRAKTKTGIVKEADNDASHSPATPSSDDDRSDADVLVEKESKKPVPYDRIEEKKATKRARESEVESSVTSDEDVMSKKRVRKNSDDCISSRPKKFVSEATKKRREAARFASEKKRAELDTDSEDDSESSSPLSGKDTSFEKKLQDSEEASEDDKSFSNKAKDQVSDDASCKLDPCKKDDSSSSAYSSDSDGEKPVVKKKFMKSHEEDKGSENEKQVMRSPKRKSNKFKKSSDVTSENSSDDVDEKPLKIAAVTNKKEKNNEGRLSVDEAIVQKNREELSDSDENVLKREGRSDVSEIKKEVSSSSEDEALVRREESQNKVVSKNKVRSTKITCESESDSESKSKKKKPFTPKYSRSSHEESSSEDNMPLKKTKQSSSKKLSDKRPKKPAAKQSISTKIPVKTEDKWSDSDADDEPLKKTKRASPPKNKVKNKKSRNGVKLEKNSKLPQRETSGSSDDSDVAKKSIVEESATKRPNSSVSKKAVKCEKKDSSSDSEQASPRKKTAMSDSEEEELSKSATKGVKIKNVKVSPSNSEDSEKELTSKSSCGEDSNPKEHQISSSDDSDVPLEKITTNTEKLGSKKNQQTSKRKSESAAHDSDSGDRKENQSKKEMSKSERKIEKMKKYVRAAGIRISSYASIWKDCKTQKQKIDKLYELLVDRGLQGNPTMEKCKKIRQKYEEKRDVEGLDLDNIIGDERDSRGQRTRSSRSSSAATVVKQEPETSSRAADYQATFSRIKKVFSSSSSDSDGHRSDAEKPLADKERIQPV